MSKSVIINNREFSLSNLDKVLWPGDGYTKGELIHYYVQIAPYIIPHLKDRPLVVTRYPNGIEGKSFYQKNAPPHTPEWIPTFPWYSSDSDREIEFILVEEMPTLAWLANQGCIEMHPWLSRTGKIDYPDFVVFDLDPSPSNTYQEIVEITRVLKELLDGLKLKSWLKTSGGEGLHIYVPIKNCYTYEQIRLLARHIAAIVVEILPDIATIERRVKQREGRVYIDYLQNVKGKTLSAPYSVRPRPGAPVSTPLEWDELTQIQPSQFTITTILSRVRDRGDLFAPVLVEKQSLDEALRLININKPLSFK
ncbi:non-homologous end-joining DNA ligase [Syntrophomonas erecta]